MADISQESVVWVRRLPMGDEEIVREFWDRYGPSLQRLAKSRMTSALQQRVGPDDVVQSVCRTFFRRARQQEFDLQGTDNLWRLLCAITLTKVRQHARFHYRQRRSPKREVPLDAESPGEKPSDGENLACAPTPAEIADFADTMQRFFGMLSGQQQALVLCKLEGLTQVEIADRLKCSERTVRRLLERVRALWDKELESSLSDAHP